MKASELTFGIEIECQFPIEYRDEVRIGGYHRGQEQDWLPEGWNIQADGSLVADSGFFTCEIASPVLKGEDGLTEVVYVLDLLKNMGVTVNDSMGTHVHVGGKKIRNKLKQLVDNWGKVETLFYRSNGEKAAVRHNSRYCQPGVGVENRFHALNLTTLPRTVEFRLLRPTVDAIQAVAAISLCVALVTASINEQTLSDGLTRKQMLKEIFNSMDRRIVDTKDEDGNEGEIWDVLLYTSKEHRKATI